MDAADSPEKLLTAVSDEPVTETSQTDLEKMTGAAHSDFIDTILPLYRRLNAYDRTRSPRDQPANAALDPVRACPQPFLDAMTIRESVYVQEQKVPLANELDDDDARSFHWVAYASVSVPPNVELPPAGAAGTARFTAASSKVPIGTIRLVPPPHPAHDPPVGGPGGDGGSGHGHPRLPSVLEDGETYVKLGRLAVLPAFRRSGIARLLIETALGLARDFPQYLDGPQPDATSVEAALRGSFARGAFQGLVVVHSQLAVQKVWARYGFRRDEAMGAWDEEGIPHCGMWRRLDVAVGRERSNKTKPYSSTSAAA